MPAVSSNHNGSPAILKEGAIVDCGTANRRGVSGVWHKVFRKSRVLQTSAFDIDSQLHLWVLPLTGEVIQIFTIPTFIISLKSSIYARGTNSQTHHLLLP